jgi:hypothetical protein
LEVDIAAAILNAGEDASYLELNAQCDGESIQDNSRHSIWAVIQSVSSLPSPSINTQVSAYSRATLVNFYASRDPHSPKAGRAISELSLHVTLLNYYTS